MGIFSWLSSKKSAAPQAEPEADAEAEESVVPVEDLAGALESSNGAARVDAARALIERWREGEIAAAEAIAPRLHELLDDDEAQVRAAALSGVRMLHKPENIERCASGVLACLADPAQPVRLQALWVAARLPGDGPRAQVRAALKSEDESVRFSAACALSDVQDAAAMPELVQALREGHRRQEAITAMMALGDAGALPPLRELFEDESLEEFDRTMTAAALARFGDASGGDHLTKRIQAGFDDQPVAAEWAGRLDVQQAIPALEELADSEGELARGAALRALGRLRAQGAEERLLSVVTDTEAADDLRMDSAEGLAELGSDKALAALRQLAQEPSDLGRLCAELLQEAAR
jgi:HEAT repeat protein